MESPHFSGAKQPRSSPSKEVPISNTVSARSQDLYRSQDVAVQSSAISALSCCPVCFEPFTEPVSLLCCHAMFCRPCLHVLLVRNGGHCFLCGSLPPPPGFAVPASSSQRTASFPQTVHHPPKARAVQSFVPIQRALAEAKRHPTASLSTPHGLSQPSAISQSNAGNSTNVAPTNGPTTTQAATASAMNESDWQPGTKNTCPICSKSFAKLSALRRHERVHTGERPFLCDFPQCGLRFAEMGNLRRHARVHTGEKPYVCVVTGCVMRFGRISHLANHAKTQHNMDVTPMIPALKASCRKRKVEAAQRAALASHEQQFNSSLKADSGNTSAIATKPQMTDPSEFVPAAIQRQVIRHVPLGASAIETSKALSVVPMDLTSFPSVMLNPSGVVGGTMGLSSAKSTPSQVTTSHPAAAPLTSMHPSGTLASTSVSVPFTFTQPYSAQLQLAAVSHHGTS